MKPPRILIAGIGNIFFGDDAFGVEVAQRLAKEPQPDGVRVQDFGIRGFDLACALMDDYDLAILVDAMPGGHPPGTLYVFEPDQPDAVEAPVEPHGLSPALVLKLVHSLGGHSPPLRVIGCEPANLGTEDEPAMGLSKPVEAAVDEAIRIIGLMIAEFAIVSAVPQKEEVLS
jgi:hydrogenase maturation protease